MKRYLPFIIVVAVALVTLATGTVLYRAKRPAVLTIPKSALVPGSGAADSMHIRGPASAPVTLEEFGDFQCPPCGKLSDPINQLEREYRPRLRVIFRHFPLPIHAHAREAALASEAAGLQGRFWEMHDLLYREQSVWSETGDVGPLFNSYAGMLRLNVDRFKKDMESEQVEEHVASDQKHGAALGVHTTPTVFLNDRALAPTSLNPTGLRAAIDAAMKTPPHT
jgi:Na+:H+ antiporter, NhaA family